MNQTIKKYPAMTGFGHARPARSVSNDELSRFMETSDEWIRSRTGIERRNISETEDTEKLAEQAARAAIEDAGIVIQKIGLIVCATITSANRSPSTACLVQKALGLNDNQIFAFDISAACSGFLFGLRTADAMMQSGDIEAALVIGAENLSKFIDWSDRSTAVIFADGAGPAVLTKSGSRPLVHFSGTAGDDEGTIRIKARGPQPFGPGPVTDPAGFIEMNGGDTFKFAVSAMEESVRQVLDTAGCTVGDIDWIVPHQANSRIIGAVTRRMRLPKDRVYINIDRWGNTSAASIPIALSEMRESGKLADGDRIILTGFGAGFSWGAALAEIGTRASASETAGARVSESDGPEAAGPEGSDTIHD